MNHVRILLAITTLSLAGTLGPCALAQTLIGFGIKAGPLASNIHGPYLLDEQGRTILSFDTVSRTGFTALATTEFTARSEQAPLTFVVEGGYVQRGYGIESIWTDIDGNPIESTVTTERFDYLSLSLTPKLRLPGTISPYVSGGPRMSVLVGGGVSIPSSNGVIGDTGPGPRSLIREFYSSTSFGVSVGVGLEMADLAPVALSAEVRRSLDLTDSFANAPRDVYNVATEFVVGVRL